jgi:hypothetical protein
VVSCRRVSVSNDNDKRRKLPPPQRLERRRKSRKVSESNNGTDLHSNPKQIQIALRHVRGFLRENRPAAAAQPLAAAAK